MTVTAETLTDAQRVAANARQIADVLDSLPAEAETPTHWQIAHYVRRGPQLQWLIFGDSSTDQKARAAALMRCLGGKWEKHPDSLFAFSSTRDGVRLEIVVDRAAVCERVVTGTREVTRKVPDPEATVPTVTVTETVEDFEWVCAPVLGDA